MGHIIRLISYHFFFFFLLFILCLLQCTNQATRIIYLIFLYIYYLYCLYIIYFSYRFYTYITFIGPTEQIIIITKIRKNAKNKLISFHLLLLFQNRQGTPFIIKVFQELTMVTD